MNVGHEKPSLVEKLANAVLYEGYILYPYRASCVKNQQRFNFGGLYPPAYSHAQVGADACRMQSQVLLMGHRPVLDVRVRFLHLISQEVARVIRPKDSQPEIELVSSIEVDGQVYYTWQEAVEREVALPGLDVIELLRRERKHVFSFAASAAVKLLSNESGEPVATVSRRQEEIVGEVKVAAEQVPGGTGDGGLFRVCVAIENQTPVSALASKSTGAAAAPTREEALPHSMASTHSILLAHEGKFLSLLDPPEHFRAAAAACQNVGNWPVLVGAEGQQDTLLCSPIILYDYPQIAPESAGDLFDGLEIDEILTLRIMSLTDEEKREMRGVDRRARAILERTERLPQEHLMKMHGVVRGVRPNGEACP